MNYLERTLKSQLLAALPDGFTVETLLGHCLDFDPEPSLPHHLIVRGPNASVKITHGSVLPSKAISYKTVITEDGTPWELYKGDNDSDPVQSYHLGDDNFMLFSFEQVIETLKRFL